MLHILKKGDLFTLSVDAIVNPVNCYGVSGAGLARQFKERLPDNQAFYESVYAKGELVPGSVAIFITARSIPKYVVNFPTKRHWTNDSKIEDIKSGLAALATALTTYDIKSIGIPALGCGLGGLEWETQVLPLLKEFANEANIPVFAIHAKRSPKAVIFGLQP